MKQLIHFSTCNLSMKDQIVFYHKKSLTEHLVFSQFSLKILFGYLLEANPKS